MPLFKPDASQKTVLDARGHQLIIGTAGSGKTTVLIEKAAALLRAGVAPQDIALSVFAFRGVEFLKALAKQNHPDLSSAWDAVRWGTLRDFAAAQLVAAGQVATFISNNQLRKYVRFLMVQQSFQGSLNEAEHIIRSLKSRAKKVPENDRFYGLYKAYQDLLTSKNQADRHDIIRNHIRGMRAQTEEGRAAPVPVKYLLVDNVHDATELQTIWLKSHAPTTTLILTANDDTTAFARDGALGLAAITSLQDVEGMLTTTLGVHYRTPVGIDRALSALVRMIPNRLHKAAEARNSSAGQATVLSFAHAPEEHMWLATQARTYALAGKKVGVITRTHTHAAVLAHALVKHMGEGAPKLASYARLVWDEPAPQTILALLHVLLNITKPAHLRLVLLGYGVPAAVVEEWFSTGLASENWMANGCALPLPREASPTTLATISSLKTLFGDAHGLMQTNQIDPRDAFKALVHALLPNLPAAEVPLALLAVDMLLSLSGKLADILPRVNVEQLPDLTAPVVVAPVTETRNMGFDVVFLPYFSADVWPQPPFKILGADADHERRLVYLACTRSSDVLVMSHHAAPLSGFATEILGNLKKP